MSRIAYLSRTKNLTRLPNTAMKSTSQVIVLPAFLCHMTCPLGVFAAFKRLLHLRIPELVSGIGRMRVCPSPPNQFEAKMTQPHFMHE